MVIILDDLNMWFQACEEWVALLWHVMPMVMENLIIVEHWNRLWYPIIWGGGY